MTFYSFGGPEYTTQGFTANRNGLSIFFTDGNRLDATYQYPFWAYEWWYSPIDTNAWWPGNYYGKLAWCIDGRTDDDSTVQNWFELLDRWFDNPTDDWNDVTY
jgi:clostripain